LFRGWEPPFEVFSLGGLFSFELLDLGFSDMEDNPLKIEKDDQYCITNLDLVFDYTKILLDAKNKTIDNINTRLGTFLGFAGILLKFGLDLPSNCTSCLVFKILTLVLSCLSVLMNVNGLLASKTGITVDPAKLMSDEYFYKPTPENKAKITNTWIILVQKLELSASEKSQKLNIGIKLIAAAVVTFTINVSIASFFKECF
jgi:hypothetical protein